MKGKVDSDDTLRHLVEAGTSAVCIVGKSWDYHVTEALETTLDEGVAMVTDSVAYLRDNDLEVLFDAEHFFDGYKAQPRVRAARARRRGAARRAPARALRHERRHAAARGRADRRGPSSTTSAPTSAWACTCTTTPGTGVANALAGVRGGAVQVQGTINGYGERTGNCNLTTIIPNLTLKMGYRDDPRRPARAAHAGRAPRRRAREHGAQPAGRVRGLVGVRPQGGPARERDRQAARRLRARAARRRRQRHALRRLGARGEVDHRCSRPRSSGSSSTGRRSTRSSTR